MKKVVTNLKDNGEKCLKWAVIAALLHEDIGNNSEPMSKLQRYEGKYNWQGLYFSLNDLFFVVKRATEQQERYLCSSNIRA